MTLTRTGIVSTLLWLGVVGCQRDVTIDLLNAPPAEPNPAPVAPSALPSTRDAGASAPMATQVMPEPSQPPEVPLLDAGESGSTGGEETVSDPVTDAASPPLPATWDAGALEPAPEGGFSGPTDPLEPPSPIHHYDFEGEGVEVFDRVGEAHGELLGGAVLDGSGGAVLDGVDDYVALPSGLVSSLSATTLVAWLEWAGGDCWQRIFDFGSIVNGEDAETYAGTSVFLTPASCPWAHFDRVSEGLVSAEFHVGGSVYFAQGDTFPAAVPTFAALVVDPTRGLEIVLDGVIVSSSPAPLSLGEIQDLNSWLGRSQWSVDAYLSGRYDEFMIFDVALSAAQLEALHTASRPPVIAPD